VTTWLVTARENRWLPGNFLCSSGVAHLRNRHCYLCCEARRDNVKKFLGSKAGGNILGVVLAVALFILIGFVFGIGGAIGGAIAGGVGFGLGGVISNARKEKEAPSESNESTKEEE